MEWIKLHGKKLVLIMYSEVALFYIDNADQDLLIFCLHHYNEIFLKYFCALTP